MLPNGHNRAQNASHFAVRRVAGIVPCPSGARGSRTRTMNAKLEHENARAFLIFSIINTPRREYQCSRDKARYHQIDILLDIES